MCTGSGNDSLLCARCSNYFNCVIGARFWIASQLMEITTFDPLWLAIIGTSAIAFILKYLGQSVPKSWLSHPRILKINSLGPVALLSALVAVQSFTKGSALIADQRLAGVAVAVVALILRAPFPVVVLSAAATSALLFHIQ